MARHRAEKHHNAEHEKKKRERHLQRLHTLSPQELRALQERRAEQHRVRISSGLVPLLAFLLCLPALEGVLLLAPSLPPRGAAVLGLLPPFLLSLALHASPLANLAAPWAELSAALALLRGACALWPARCDGRVALALQVALHVARLLVVALRLPDATRRTWRFLRGVEDEPLRPISVRRQHAAAQGVLGGPGLAHARAPSVFPPPSGQGARGGVQSRASGAHARRPRCEPWRRC
jgi:hypothetical protein